MHLMLWMAKPMIGMGNYGWWGVDDDGLYAMMEWKCYNSLPMGI